MELAGQGTVSGLQRFVSLLQAWFIEDRVRCPARNDVGACHFIPTDKSVRAKFTVLGVPNSLLAAYTQCHVRACAIKDARQNPSTGRG